MSVCHESRKIALEKYSFFSNTEQDGGDTFIIGARHWQTTIKILRVRQPVAFFKDLRRLVLRWRDVLTISSEEKLFWQAFAASPAHFSRLEKVVLYPKRGLINWVLDGMPLDNSERTRPPVQTHDNNVAKSHSQWRKPEVQLIRDFPRAIKEVEATRIKDESEAQGVKRH